MTDAELSPSWWTRWVGGQVTGLITATLAVPARWAAGGLPPGAVPVGLLMAGLAGGLLVAVRRPLTVVVGLLAAGLVALNLAALADGQLGVASTSALLGAALGLQIVGVLLAVAAGAGALVVAAGQTWSARHDRVRTGRRTRVGQVLGLLLLSPICAEYLAAYDSSTGHPAELLAGLYIFIPLYGCAALLIRELARRAGLGWVGIVLLAAAFGLLEAGVIDQSMFSPDYRGIEGWEATYRATLFAPFGLSVANLVTFVGGHVVLSIGAPIAVIEGGVPTSSGRPWLGRIGLAVTGAVWAWGAVVVLRWHLRTEDWHASAAQVGGSLAVVLGLVAAAYLLGRRRGRIRPPADLRPAPRVAVVFVAAVLLSAAQSTSPETWIGVLRYLGCSGLAVVGMVLASRRRGWGVPHVSAIAAAPLLVQGVLAFTYQPLVGEVAPVAKYAHNVVMLAIVVGVSVLALLASRPQRGTGFPAEYEAGRHAA